MAPPKGKRSSFSRKAQYGVFTGYVLAVFGALIGAGLLIVSVVQPEAFATFRGAANDAASPVGEAGASVRTGGQGVFSQIAAYWRAGSKNDELQEELAIAKVELEKSKAIEAENKRLKALLGLEEHDGEPVALARLIGATSSSTRRYAVISAGSADGVESGMPVSSALGLVGRVVETGALTSRVLLLTDIESRVPVRRAGDDTVAFAEGRIDGTLQIRLINLGINPIKEGDVFVTSGAGGLFRPGTAVAVAEEITPDGAIARLLSNPAGTDYVRVEPVWQPDLMQAAESGELDDLVEGQADADAGAEAAQ
jgi:rod shape-determining protein MreC